MRWLLVFLIAVSFNVAASEFYGKEVKYTYQRDTLPNTEFEFALKESGNHSCAGTVYLVKSPSVEIANRKFSMLLAATASAKKIDFGSNDNCSDGNRLDVSWVRLVN